MCVTTKATLVSFPGPAPAVPDELQKPIRSGVRVFQVLRIELQEIGRRLLGPQLTRIQATNGLAAPSHESLPGPRDVFRPAEEVVAQVVTELGVAKGITPLAGSADEEALDRLQAVRRIDPLGAEEP